MKYQIIKHKKRLLIKAYTTLRNKGLRQTLFITKNYLKGRGNRNNGLVAADYQEWIAKYDTIRSEDVIEMKRDVETFKYKPLISVIVPVYNTEPNNLRLMLETVINQAYTNWELCIAEDCSDSAEVKEILKEYESKDKRIKVKFREENGNISAASNTALKLANGEFVALVDHDDVLPLHALYAVVKYINIYDNKVDLLYSDEDKIDGGNRRYNPYFKTDWNPQLFIQQNFIAHLGVYRKEIIDKIGGFRIGFEGSQDYDLALRFIKEIDEQRIVHIPYVLYHWRIFEGNSTFSTDHHDISDNSAYRALQEYFGDSRISINLCESLRGCWKIVDKRIESKPLVSIIIPTKDRVEILRNCVEGLLENTEYPNFEIIIIDNNSQYEATHNYYRTIENNSNLKIIYNHESFNYSRLNNLAVQESNGSLLLFLNNDIAIIEKEWLDVMVTLIQKENVGIVGNKLLYSNEHIQHAGVTLGIYEVAAHSFRHLQKDDVGYFGFPVLERNVSAVTGACLLTKREVFEKVEGFDEENLRVSYNDVDYCLKVRKLGMQILYTPYSKLYHLESISRGDDNTSEKKQKNYEERHFMIEKYGKDLMQDLYYSPNLSVENEDCSLAFPPRVGKLWRDRIEFVCPFHRGDVLLGLQVALTAKKLGVNVRMHVSEKLMSWIECFDYKEYIEIESIPIGIPSSEETMRYFEEAVRYVELREDSSALIAQSHPHRDIDKMGVNLVENMLRQLQLPIQTKLVNFYPKECDSKEKDVLVNEMYHLGEKLILLHPLGGWNLKSIPFKIANQICDKVHEMGYKIVQIGGSSDQKYPMCDGWILENYDLDKWNVIIRNASAIIGVDSWTSHFASIINCNQVIVYGSTKSRDVCSKHNFENQAGECLILDSDCESVPCHATRCKYGSLNCLGINVDMQKLEEFMNKCEE